VNGGDDSFHLGDISLRGVCEVIRVDDDPLALDVEHIDLVGLPWTSAPAAVQVATNVGPRPDEAVVAR
jgi:hypothetical protein